MTNVNRYYAVKALKLLLLSCFTFMLVPFAQTQVNLQRQVMAATGALGNNDSAKLSISYTVGETIARTAVGSSGSFVVTMGFQQPDDIFVSIGDQLEATLQYQIYPNPTPEVVFVTLSTDKPVDLILAITDLTGRKLSVPDQSHRISGTQDTQFNLSALADGYYLLSLKMKPEKYLSQLKLKKFTKLVLNHFYAKSPLFILKQLLWLILFAGYSRFQCSGN